MAKIAAFRTDWIAGEGRFPLGAAQDVKTRLDTLAAAHGAEEPIIVTISYDFTSRPVVV
ncbi:MAG: hypothetical protein KGO02_14660 [Alphaproteobacteria bacterium]|nr:hypothetical protein [Alphaproteobacteria bacterium]